MTEEREKIIIPEQISNGEFLKLLLEAEAFWMEKLKTAIDKLQHLSNIRNKYNEAVNMGLRVKRFKDDKNNFWFEAEVKDQAGFKHE